MSAQTAPLLSLDWLLKVYGHRWTLEMAAPQALPRLVYESEDHPASRFQETLFTLFMVLARLARNCTRLRPAHRGGTLHGGGH
ncbi:hypothetical protein CCUS01_01613 [Colletotrichum cuscutae]|uniref:Uncharacterized protein n=1 Tax=Colletotrichum cuscutae TaxID=1209917 RepID=A0AAI9UHJ6_9PEZI|nr:hypothetical protein CCUS01_01613 [Colletotrichum cuscutae]